MRKAKPPIFSIRCVAEIGEDFERRVKSTRVNMASQPVLDICSGEDHPNIGGGFFG